MRLNLLVLSFLSIFAFSLPAEAANLLFWRFYPEQNRLVFTTDGRVQPKALLLANPTRLVIDLPGTFLQRPTITQPLGGAMRSLRVGQFDETTTRIAIELIPGYTLDPQKILVRGATPQQWSVQIPTPQRIAQLPGNSPTPPPAAPSETRAGQLPPSASGRELVFEAPSRDNSRDLVAKIQTLQVTEQGLLIRTTGSAPTIRITRSDDRRAINIELSGATLFPSLFLRDRPIDRYGVSRIQFAQVATSSPPIVRVTLNVTQNSPNWQAFFTKNSGVVLRPFAITATEFQNPSQNR